MFQFEECHELGQSMRSQVVFNNLSKKKYHENLEQEHVRKLEKEKSESL